MSLVNGVNDDDIHSSHVTSHLNLVHQKDSVQNDTVFLFPVTATKEQPWYTNGRKEYIDQEDCHLLSVPSALTLDPSSEKEYNLLHTLKRSKSAAEEQDWDSFRILLKHLRSGIFTDLSHLPSGHAHVILPIANTAHRQDPTRHVVFIAQGQLWLARFPSPDPPCPLLVSPTWQTILSTARKYKRHPEAHRQDTLLAERKRLWGPTDIEILHVTSDLMIVLYLNGSILIGKLVSTSTFRLIPLAGAQYPNLIDLQYLPLPISKPSQIWFSAVNVVVKGICRVRLTLPEANDFDSISTQCPTKLHSGDDMDLFWQPPCSIDYTIPKELDSVMWQPPLSSSWKSTRNEPKGVLIGIPEFCMQEEFARWSGVWVQPSGDAVMYSLVNESAVDKLNVISIEPSIRYPRPGMFYLFAREERFPCSYKISSLGFIMLPKFTGYVC
jgi:hypothetical protein